MDLWIESPTPPHLLYLALSQSVSFLIPNCDILRFCLMKHLHMDYGLVTFPLVLQSPHPKPDKSFSHLSFFFFLKSSPKVGRDGGRQGVKDKYQCERKRLVASCMRPNWGSKAQPFGVPANTPIKPHWPGHFSLLKKHLQGLKWKSQGG